MESTSVELLSMEREPAPLLPMELVLAVELCEPIRVLMASMTVWASSAGNSAITVAIPSLSGYIRTLRVSRAIATLSSKVSGDI